MAQPDRIARLLGASAPWLTDGGLETHLIFHDNIDLPHFASFQALETEAGLAALDAYFRNYVDLARQSGTGLVLDTATWRSGAFWAETLGRSVADMEGATRAAVSFARGFRDRHETESLPIVVNGAVGPAGDGYDPERIYTADEAFEVHAPQARWMADAGVDIITAVTMTHPGEGIGVARAAQEAGVPYVIGFTTETDGRLPTGQSLDEAIAETEAATDAGALFYMINCAHPDHFSGALQGDWLTRIGAIRANASRMSHAQLDEAEDLDDGDPDEFGRLYRAMAPRLPNLRVIGGCCGTDHRHVACAARHLVQPVAA